MDAARYGIQTLAPQFFDGAQPDFLVSGPNVGSEFHAILASDVTNQLQVTSG